MLLDHFTFRALVTEIAEAIRGDRITSAGLSNRHSLLLTFRRNKRLVISVAPELPCCFLASYPGSTSRLTPYLDDRLLGATVREVEADPHDRVARLTLVSSHPLGRETVHTLVVELTGRNSNLILVDTMSGQVIHALRRVTAEMSRVRRIVPGAVYVPPPLPDRLFPTMETAVTSFLERMTSRDFPESSLPLADRLLRVLPGLTPVTSREIICMAGGDAGAVTDDAAICERLWSTALDLYRNFSPAHAHGVLVLDSDGRPSGITVLGARNVPDDRKVPLSSLSAGVESLNEGRMTGCFSSIRSAVVRRLRSVERKLSSLEKDLDEAKQADLLQKKGHILMAHLHQIPKWVSSIELEDFYAGDGSMITIDLDPVLPPVENAKRYLVRAKKAKIGEALIVSWIETTRQEFDYLSELVQRLSGDVPLSQEQLQDLEARYVLPVRFLRRRSATPYAAPRRYITTDGWKVVVGRSQEENDLLLRGIADREDIWLHAQGCPGAHVILHREDRRGDPPRRTLEEAAALAAYWSKARGAKTVPVIHTRVKYVRKPKGASPGAVTVTHEKTIFVEPGLLPLLRR